MRTARLDSHHLGEVIHVVSLGIFGSLTTRFPRFNNSNHDKSVLHPVKYLSRCRLLPGNIRFNYVL